MADEQQAVELSLVMPAYDEQHRIGPTLREYLEHFTAGYGERFEIIVVLNGCTDGTRGVVEATADPSRRVRIVEFPQLLGKGGAIWEGLAVARGERIGFVDADNMVRAPEAEKLFQALDSNDVAIGDRFSGVEEGGGQNFGRKLISLASRLWIRRFLGLPYSDTQCGAKAFRASAWRELAQLVVERSWAFDLDVLANATQLGYRIAQVPVRWKHVTLGSKVQAWRDVPRTLWATFRIRRRARRP